MTAAANEATPTVAQNMNLIFAVMFQLPTRSEFCTQSYHFEMGIAENAADGLLFLLDFVQESRLCSWVQSFLSQFLDQADGFPGVLVNWLQVEANLCQTTARSRRERFASVAPFLLYWH